MQKIVKNLCMCCVAITALSPLRAMVPRSAAAAGAFDCTAVSAAAWKEQRFLAIASCGNAAALEQLIQERVNINVVNHLGQTAMHLAAERGNVDMVEMLIKYRASLTMRDRHGQTPLKAAKNMLEAQRSVYLESGSSDVIGGFIKVIVLLKAADA